MFDWKKEGSTSRHREYQLPVTVTGRQPVPTILRSLIKPEKKKQKVFFVRFRLQITGSLARTRPSPTSPILHGGSSLSLFSSSRLNKRGLLLIPVSKRKLEEREDFYHSLGLDGL